MKALLLLIIIAGTALADETDWQRCRGIKDPAARLACYDALVSAPGKDQPAVRPQPGATQPSSPQAAAGQFGLEQRASKPEQEAIQSHIPGRFEGWQANSRIALANGQVWIISDGSSAYYDLVDPKVTIRRGMLGAFYLEIEGKNRSPRVKRIQ